MDAGIFVEGSKVVGQNSVRVAGQVIIGNILYLWREVRL